MAEKNYSGKIIQLALSFLFGFLFIVLLIILGGGLFIGKNANENENNKKNDNTKIRLVTYNGPTYSISYPENYDLSENKIIATEGIMVEQENTIHLISPNLPDSDGNLSIIITHKPLKKYQEENIKSSTCPELYEKKLDEIEIGTQTFTTSGQIFCGPNEVSFFYIINNENVYEIKVETTANYEEKAYPEVLNILKTMKFKE